MDLSEVTRLKLDECMVRVADGPGGGAQEARLRAAPVSEGA
ncbi:hypothetical protein [Desulfothermobacter acidiphilus]